MDINILREIATVLSFGTFLGIMGWAWWRGNRSRFDEAAQLPFTQED
jgi:cytochrome c oxidase cbb3-type subunit 4